VERAFTKGGLMMDDKIEKEILEHVRQHPGCGRVDLLATIGDKNVANEIDCMVAAGNLDRWYTGTVPVYYIPGTYRPSHLIAYTEDMQDGIIPLASGLRIERDDDDVLILHPREFARWRAKR
jgi:hypothetical protein